MNTLDLAQSAGRRQPYGPTEVGPLPFLSTYPIRAGAHAVGRKRAVLANFSDVEPTPTGLVTGPDWYILQPLQISDKLHTLAELFGGAVKREAWARNAYLATVELGSRPVGPEQARQYLRVSSRYDRASLVTFELCQLQLACANGMLGIVPKARWGYRHDKLLGVALDTIESRLTDARDAWDEFGGMAERWAAVVITVAETEYHLQAIARQFWPGAGGASERRREQFVGDCQVRRQAPQGLTLARRGTLWGLFQCVGDCLQYPSTGLAAKETPRANALRTMQGAHAPRLRVAYDHFVSHFEPPAQAPDRRLVRGVAYDHFVSHFEPRQGYYVG